jgi:hypothetical protein
MLSETTFLLLMCIIECIEFFCQLHARAFIKSEQ